MFKFVCLFFVLLSSLSAEEEIYLDGLDVIEWDAEMAVKFPKLNFKNVVLVFPKNSYISLKINFTGPFLRSDGLDTLRLRVLQQTYLKMEEGEALISFDKETWTPLQEQFALKTESKMGLDKNKRPMFQFIVDLQPQ